MNTDLEPTPDHTPPQGLAWEDGLDALDALLTDCAQDGRDHLHWVRVGAVRDIVNAVRRYNNEDWLAEQRAKTRNAAFKEALTSLDSDAVTYALRVAATSPTEARARLRDVLTVASQAMYGAVRDTADPEPTT